MSLISILVTLTDLRRALEALTAPAGSSHVWRMDLHPNRHRDGIEWIARATTSSGVHEAAGRLLVWTFSQPDSLPPPEASRLLQRSDACECMGLGIGIGAMQGQILSLLAPSRRDLDPGTRQLRLVGPGMDSFDLASQGLSPLAPGWLYAQGLYSRSVGVVGIQAFGRLQRSRIAVIGAGGNGSLMASLLARYMGCQGRLAIIDPDRIARYNLPAWAALSHDSPEALIGGHKAEALADYLRAFPDPPQIETLSLPVRDWSAQALLKRYDILVCCVDNPEARYVVAYLAALYHRVVLDVGTGVFLGRRDGDHQVLLLQEKQNQTRNYPETRGRLPRALLEAGPRSMGADVRLIVPGRSDQPGNCLLCQGGVGDLAAARRSLAQPLPERPVTERVQEPFWQERAGSFVFLNSEACSVAGRLLTAFLGGEIPSSLHWQMDVTPAAPTMWRQVMHNPDPACPLCRRSGLADDAWEERSQALSELMPQNPVRS